MPLLDTLLSIQWAAQYHYLPGKKAGEHRHRTWQIVRFLNDGACITHGKERHAMPCGSLALFGPDQRHSIANPTSITVRTFDIKFLATDPALFKLLQANAGVYNDQKNYIAGLLERIVWEGDRQMRFFTSMAQSLLLQAILTIARQAPPPAGIAPGEKLLVRDPMVSQLCEFIHERYAAPLESADLGQAVGCSYSNCAKRFRTILGISPVHYLSEYRLRQAKKMLRYDDLPLKQIAAKAGLGDISHFSRFFRSREGVTPSQWRDAARFASGCEVTFKNGEEL
jgi:AraC-like DNA-binding protein